jgi:hypothetical protein
MAAADGAPPPLQAQSIRRGEGQAQSKRDRKRQVILDRFTALEDKFSRDRDPIYRDQLQRIQIDTTLVQRFDPYGPNALSELEDALEQHRRPSGQGAMPENARKLLDMAGPSFHDWAESMGDLIERRDFQLTRLHVRFQFHISVEEQWR